MLVNPDSSEIELAILNARLVSGNVLEFETLLKADTFYWSLTVKTGTRGLLHGSCREMLIDEPVVRRH